jgi:hypothetical protein
MSLTLSDPERLNARTPERPERSDMTEITLLDLLLIERVEHRPAGRQCRACRHLGTPVRVTEAHGARRLRRACAAGARAVTDPDWPACARFAEASAAS